MKEEMEIIKAEEKILAVADRNTGLMVGDTFKAVSGFNYIVGAREFGDLTITESIGQGTAVAYLNCVRVYDSEKNLIIDKQVDKGIHYSRETVRQIVFVELLKMLEEAAKKENKKFDRVKAKEVIDEKLKAAYYQQSYQSVLSWAKDIGIEII